MKLAKILGPSPWYGSGIAIWSNSRELLAIKQMGTHVCPAAKDGTETKSQYINKSMLLSF